MSYDKWKDLNLHILMAIKWFFLKVKTLEILVKKPPWKLSIPNLK